MKDILLYDRVVKIDLFLFDNSNPNRKEVLSNDSLFLSSTVIHKFKHVFLYLLIFYLLWWFERKLSPNGVALGVT